MLDAIGILARERLDRGLPGGLVYTLQNTAELLGAPVSTFDGMMEAPPEINSLYGTHRMAFEDLPDHHDRVLGRLLDDLAGLVLSYELGEVLWSDLIRLSATREQPPAPMYASEWD
ncbi:hypothetical protein [Nocardioides sp. GCM10030258]|uniref:hypothetical protein n=1 Tax=unclassified Nocardioides TaxID=2615069 RepID=UPI003606AC1D